MSQPIRELGVPRPTLRPLQGDRKSPWEAGRPRIEWLRIDGFGGVTDLHLDGFSPGLTVILGPNEAGKSTVFDFLSAVLFGFPTRKRSDPRYRSPVPGSPHGGSIGLADGAEPPYVIERYALPVKRLTLTLPDGSPGDGDDLHRLLGGANPELFAAVFAVDLDDLRRLESMSSDEVREVIFSSGILGKSRSVARALKDLDARRDELVRPRQGARANELSGKISALREQLEDARRRARRYSTLSEELQVRSDTMDTLRRERLQLSDRLSDLATLLGCHDATRRLEQLLDERDRHAEPTAVECAHIAQAGAIMSLRSELSGHRERVGRLGELERRLAGLDRSVIERTAQLGEWAPAVVTAPGFDADELSGRLQPLSQRQRDAAATLRTNEMTVRCARDDLEALRARREDQPQPPTAGELQHRLRALRELRSITAEVADLEREMRQGVAVPQASVQGRVVAMGIVLIALLAGTPGLLLLRRGGAAPILLLGVAAALVLLAAWMATKTSPLHAGRPGTDGGMGLPSSLARAQAERQQVASDAGIDAELSPAALQRLIDETEAIVEERRQLDTAAANEQAADDRLVRLLYDERRAREELATAEDEIAKFCRHNVLPPYHPDILERLLVELGVLRERIESQQEVARAREQLLPDLVGYEDAVAALAHSLDLFPPRCEGPEGARTESAEADLGSTLDDMAATLAAATGRAEARASLDAQIAELSKEIERQIGIGSRSQALRRELDSSQVSEWKSERSVLETRRVEMDGRYEEAVRAHHQVSLELDELAASSDVAVVEQRCLELEEELRETLRRYIVAGASRLVLRRTLKRYEDERQPAVLEAAGAHFARITGGRYVRLAVDSSAELPSVRAIRADGTAAGPDELSRGTAEQLYLCLRLALAESFAGRYVALPIVLDDVLVNFDPERQAAVARELAAAAERHQVILLTCHPHVAVLVAAATGGSSTTIEMGTARGDRGGVRTG